MELPGSQHGLSGGHSRRTAGHLDGTWLLPTSPSGNFQNLSHGQRTLAPGGPLRQGAVRDHHRSPTCGGISQRSGRQHPPLQGHLKDAFSSTGPGSLGYGRRTGGAVALHARWLPPLDQRHPYGLQAFCHTPSALGGELEIGSGNGDLHGLPIHISGTLLVQDG